MKQSLDDREQSCSWSLGVIYSLYKSRQTKGEKQRNASVLTKKLTCFQHFSAWVVETCIYLIIIPQNACFQLFNVVSLRELYLLKQADKQNENYLD